jgi:hypothetical protein
VADGGQGANRGKIFAHQLYPCFIVVAAQKRAIGCGFRVVTYGIVDGRNHRFIAAGVLFSGALENIF